MCVMVGCRVEVAINSSVRSNSIFTGLRAARCWAESEQPVKTWYDREMPEFQKFRIVD